MKKYKKAFTLAEVLITLLIIGVVASLVIPALINNTNDAEIKTSMKKEVAVISQVAKMVIMDNGGTAKGLCATDDNRCIRDLFLNYMSYTKKCSSSPEPGSWDTCFVRTLRDGGTWKNLDGSTPTVGTDATAVLNDGTLIHFWQSSYNCNLNGSRTCARIFFDVNGFKGPNITGKDIFLVWLNDDGIKPAGAPGLPVPNDYPGANLTAQYLQQ